MTMVNGSGRNASLLLLLLVGVGGVPSPAFSAAIPKNTWVDMDATAVMGPEKSQTDSAEPDYRAFSSMEATDDGRIIYWGGGHANYGGNDMDVYHAAANQWTQETEEENWKQRLQQCWADAPDPPDDHACTEATHPWRTAHLGKDGRPSADDIEQAYNTGTVRDFLTGRGRPGTRHVYQQMAWWPQKGWFVFDFKHSLWAWDPDQGDANGAMMKINDAQANQGFADIFYWNIAHDPDSGSLVSFNTADASAYRLKDGDWRKVIDLPFEGGKGEIYSEYHAADGVHYVSRWNDLYIVDLDAGAATDIPESPPAAVGNNAMWFEYSPSREQMLVMGHDSGGELGLWGFDSGNDLWQRIPMSGTVKRANGTELQNEDVRWDMLERDPVSGNFYFLAINKGRPFSGPPTYAFRLADDAGQSAPSSSSPRPVNEWATLPIPSEPAGLPKGNGKDFQMEWVESSGDIVVCCGDWLQNDGVKHNGNEHLLTLAVEDNTWTQEMDHCSGDPQPEGWDEVAVAYDSKRDELWGFPGFQWQHDACTTDINGETMAYDFANEAWRVTGHGNMYNNDDTGFGDYDPVTDRFYISDRPGVDAIDPEDPEAGIVASYSDADYHSEAHQSFLDVRGRGFYITDTDDTNRLVRFDMDAKSFTPVTDLPDGVIGSNAYAVWNPKHRVIMSPMVTEWPDSGRSNEVAIYHVDTGQWQMLRYPIDGEKPFGNSVGFDVDAHTLVVFGTKDYPELQDVFALHYDPQTAGDVESWVPGSGEDPVTVVFGAQPATITRGSSATLTWNTANATSCAASGGWSGTKAANDATTVSPPMGTTSYTLTCSDGSGDEATKSITVAVEAGDSGSSSGGGGGTGGYIVFGLLALALGSRFACARGQAAGLRRS